MLYHLLAPHAGSFPLLNLFRYITFRAAWAFMTALLLCYLLYPPFIAWMRAKRMEQAIRIDGPQEHLETKVGTPTMGGMVMLFAIGLSTVLWARLDIPLVGMALVITLGYGVVGLADDWKKVMERHNAGISGKVRLGAEFGLAFLVLGWAYSAGLLDPVLTVPFFKRGTVDFSTLIPGMEAAGWLWVGFGMLVLVGACNAVNLTDGLDGLAIGPVMTSAGTFAILAYIAGNTVFSSYLQVPYVAGAGELTVFAMAMLGAGLGFLWYNTYPAQVFMGDVGSLGLGGALGVLAVLTRHEILLALVGGIFVLETVSVILQVLSFKLTGKRIFAMAPIHHHYEKKGWSEPKIIVRFWIISILLALVALSTLKVR
jgi:phospho-N-acetylmuramoyl-pentapeptide-transferase